MSRPPNISHNGQYYNPSIQAPFGIRTLNPVPVDWYSGPFTGGSTGEAIARANAFIFPSERYRSQEVRLLVGSDTYKYWYYGGTADSDLVPFSAAGVVGAGGTGATGSTGFGFTAAFVGEDGQLYISVLFPSGQSGNSFSVGYVRGKTGADGSPGSTGATGSTGFGFTAAFVGEDGQLYISVLFPSGASSSPFSIGRVQGDTGPSGIAGDYVSTINSLTGQIQVSAGENVSISLSGNTLTISSKDVFDTDLTAAFPIGKTFGKYSFGDPIPAQGKTAVEVIQDALRGAVEPEVSLTVSPTNYAFYTETIQNTLNFGYTIRSLGATAASGTLEWKRGNQSTWTVLNPTLFSSSGTTYSGSFVHNTTNSPRSNTNSFDYRYTVTDSEGGTKTTPTASVTISGYLSPFVSLSQVGSGVRSGLETVTVRERGNNSNTISGSVTNVRSPLVPPTSWQTQVSRYVNGVFQGWEGVSSGTWATAPYSVSSHTHSAVANANLTQVRYRLLITDAHTTNEYLYDTINFYNLIWYGATASTPTTSNHIRNGGLSVSIPISLADPFDFPTGTEYNRFVVAFPDPTTIVSALEIPNVNLTNDFVLSESLIAVNDFAGISTPYNVYVYSPTSAYNTSRTIRIDRS